MLLSPNNHANTPADGIQVPVCIAIGVCQIVSGMVSQEVVPSLPKFPIIAQVLSAPLVLEGWLLSTAVVAGIQCP